MKKLKVMTVVGTRPDIIKLSEVIKRCDQHFDHMLVHTGQNYDYRLNQLFFEDLDLREPDVYLGVAGAHLGQTMGNVIEKSYELMAKEKPDAVLILGDTNSSLSAISAKRHKIPIFHMEAGNRCFDENLPEEINRRIVDHISDINMPYSEHARRYLLAEGIAAEHIYVTGSPMKEVLAAHAEKIARCEVVAQLGLKKGNYILLSAHREENIDDERHFLSLMHAVNEMAEHYQMPVIYSVHPRSAKFIEERGFVFHPLVKKMPPFSFTEFNRLQRDAYCVVSDSGTLPEESALGHFPAVSIRTSTERPEAFDQGCFVLGGISAEQLLQSVEMAVKMSEEGFTGNMVPAYDNDHVSYMVVKTIQSYVGIINDRVWRK